MLIVSLLCLCWVFRLNAARVSLPPRLNGYYVNKSAISVSGISAGGFMAVQYQIAFSSDIMGSGIVAGGPYYCAEDDVEIALHSCTKEPAKINVETLIDLTTEAAAVFSIDSLSHLRQHRTYVFSGTLDSVVEQGVGIKLVKYLSSFVDPRNIKTVLNITAEHSMPTLDYGNSCATLGTPFINACQYDAAYDILNHIYDGGIFPSPDQAVPGNLISFDQAEFFAPYLPDVIGMDTIGFVYIPTMCRSKAIACRLHVNFHGCLQSYSNIENVYVENAGFNGHAERNGIIVLYPQSVATDLNPKCCFDWWGYTGIDYACKLGLQMITVQNMINRLSGD